MNKQKKFRILKTLSWRILAFNFTLVVVYILTGKLKLAGLLSLAEVSVKLVLYYYHEKFWEFKWRKQNAIRKKNSKV